MLPGVGSVYTRSPSCDPRWSVLILREPCSSSPGGSKNTAGEVFFTDADEAAILVKASNGISSLMANLTNLAAWRADGTIPSDQELKTGWLRLP